jgi:hypothetical protein
MLRIFPMILIAVIAYNVVVFGSGAAGQHDMTALLAQGFSVTVFSGDVWKVSLGDMFLTGTLQDFSYWLIEQFPWLATIG